MKKAIGIIIILLVLVGGYWIFSGRTRTELAEQKISPNIFTDQISVGEKYGGMTVEKVEFADDELGAVVEFTGKVTITGTINFPKKDDIYFANSYSIRDITPESQLKLPTTSYDNRTLWFVIQNSDIIKNSDINDSDKVTVTIDSYRYSYKGTETVNSAHVIAIERTQ